MVTSAWDFERDPRSAVGFQSGNRASTDAINALEAWCPMVVDRAYAVLSETDDMLRASLTIDPRDSNAGADLDELCSRFGIQRRKAAL